MDIWPVYYVLTFTAVSAGILEGPNSGSYTAGTNVTLPCIVDRNADKTYWIDHGKGVKTIFDNREKVEAGDKYDNFYLGQFSYSDFSLHIMNASVTDDGSYTCQAGDESQTATITIEAPPTLKLFINRARYETDAHPESQSFPRSVTIICHAIGAKPSVNLRLKINDGHWIEQPNANVTQNDLLFDSYISHNHTFLQNDISVTCQAYGQTSIPLINITEILYKPTCNITLVAADIVCSCDAYPPVYKYVMLMDGKEAKEVSRLSIVDHPATSYSCLGTNYIGTSQSQPFSVTGYHNESKLGVVSIVVVSVVIIVVVCVVVVLVLLFRRRRSKEAYKVLAMKEKSNSEITQQVPKELEQLISKVAPLIKVDWEIFAIDDLRLSEKEVLGIVDKDKSVKEKVELVLFKWVACTKRKPTDKNLLKLLKASSVCLDFNCNNCSEVLKETDLQLSSETQLTSLGSSPNTESPQSEDNLESGNAEALVQSSSEICSLFACVGDLIGNTGAARLAGKYKINWPNQPCHKPGDKILMKLTETKTLEYTNHSIELFCKNLYKCCLLGAYRAVNTCINEDLENFIDIVSHRIRLDWEIFAIDDLKLQRTFVEKVCSEEKDPVKTVLTTWTQQFDGLLTKYTLINTMINSKVCKDPNNGCAEILKDMPDFEPLPNVENLDNTNKKYEHPDDVRNDGYKCFRVSPKGKGLITCMTYLWLCNDHKRVS